MDDKKAHDILSGYELTVGSANVLKEPLKVALEALERQIPMKVDTNGIDHKTFTCPVCGRLYWEKEQVGDYCDSCGQKLSY